MSDGTEVQESETLYDKMVEITGLEKDSDTTSDEYKIGLVKFFSDYPDDDFEKLSEDVQEWVNSATEVAKKNRGSRKVKALPALNGLDEEEVKEPKKRGRKPSAEPKAAKEPKERGPNRYLRAFRELVKNPEMTYEALADKINVALPAGKYCVEAFQAARTAFTEAGVMK